MGFFNTISDTFSRLSGGSDSEKKDFQLQQKAEREAKEKERKRLLKEAKTKEMMAFTAVPSMKPDRLINPNTTRGRLIGR